ncbi:HEPN domain-containing protein [bacterium]|nr:HEPN domain-containing protein [bacterium]
MARPLESKNVLLQSAYERLRDARVLVRRGNKRYTGAVYLGGYVIECLLKAAICVEQRTERLPVKYRTHELESLLETTGYRPTMTPEIAAKFRVIVGWNVQLRYQGRQYQANDARTFLTYVEVIRKWLLEKMSP